MAAAYTDREPMCSCRVETGSPTVHNAAAAASGMAMQCAELNPGKRDADVDEPA